MIASDSLLVAVASAAVIAAEFKARQRQRSLASLQKLLHHNFFLQVVQCVRKVAVHLQKVLEVMSKSVYTGLNPN
jgi:ABC-type sugar transport system substrate-binding protein